MVHREGTAVDREDRSFHTDQVAGNSGRLKSELVFNVGFLMFRPFFVVINGPLFS
jgi:hypothetical protein